MITLFGAGQVYTVTQDAHTLSADLVEKIASNVEESSTLSMAPLLEDLFQDVKVSAPGKNLALILVASMLLAVTVFGQKPEDDSKKAIAIIVVSLSLAIVFGVILAQDAVRGSLHSTEIKINTNVGGGLTVAWTKLYSLVDTEVELISHQGSMPMLDLPRKYQERNYDSTWVEGQGVKVSLGKNESRVFSYSRSWKERMSFKTEGGEEIQITNDTEREFSKTLIFKEGRIYDLGRLAPGDHTVMLRARQMMEDVEKLPDPYAKSLGKIIQDYSLREGTWMVSFQRDNEDLTRGNRRVNRREMDLFLIAPEGSSGD